MDHVPSPPGVVLSGLIWPPLTGRALLQTALQAPSSSMSSSSAPQVLTTAHGWRLHTPGTFTDIDTARAALIAWARVHEELAAFVSTSRCVLVADDDEIGWRLWQVVGPSPSVWTQLSSALAGRDHDAIASAITTVTSTCTQVGKTWPTSLPCTLETVGVDGRFVSLMPAELSTATTTTSSGDRCARLLRQVSWLVRSSLGEAAASLLSSLP
ncbi:MAG TPA: hypothetical protein VGF99_05395 [Myxococcota bacterium]